VNASIRGIFGMALCIGWRG